MSGLGAYLDSEQLAQYSSNPTEDPGRPAVTFSGVDFPDTLVVVAVTAQNPTLASEWDIAMHFRATSATAVDGIADAVAEHFGAVFGLSARGWSHGTAVTMPSITVDGGLVLTNVARKTRGAIELTAPKPQLNTNRFSRVDTYQFSVRRA